ncbi:unnamed protein product [Brassica oleracea var. botrytis]|uniref:Uncharacterized protein n=2 Tax=Brassica TaxID=3705 RepID=A0A3P6GD99_BRAOL|nr:hypothetical protein HID58_079564 [Brassica napus]CAF2106298.1 unnamed protein product [Brassica napus]VDD54202.1 unnamed protein product [Brassica oleracea]
MGGGGEEETVNVDEETMGGDSSRGAHLALMKQSVMVVVPMCRSSIYKGITPLFFFNSSIGYDQNRQH